MTSTDQVIAESQANRAALRQLSTVAAITTQDELEATLTKIADWAFVINQSHADRALISPVVQEMTGWVRDYRDIVHGDDLH